MQKPAVILRLCLDNFDDLDKELELAKTNNQLSFIEVMCSIGARMVLEGQQQLQ